MKNKLVPIDLIEGNRVSPLRTASGNMYNNRSRSKKAPRPCTIPPTLFNTASVSDSFTHVQTLRHRWCKTYSERWRRASTLRLMVASHIDGKLVLAQLHQLVSLLAFFTLVPSCIDPSPFKVCCSTYLLGIHLPSWDDRLYTIARQLERRCRLLVVVVVMSPGSIG